MCQRTGATTPPRRSLTERRLCGPTYPRHLLGDVQRRFLATTNFLRHSWRMFWFLVFAAAAGAGWWFYTAGNRAKEKYAQVLRDAQGPAIDMYLEHFHASDGEAELIQARDDAFRCLRAPDFVVRHNAALERLRTDPSLYRATETQLVAMSLVEALALSVTLLTEERILSKYEKDPKVAAQIALIRRNSAAKMRPSKLLPGGLWACGACGAMLDGDQVRCTCG